MRSSMRQPGTLALPSGQWLELPHLDEVGESPDADQVADGARRQLPLFMAFDGAVERDPSAIHRNLDAVTNAELEGQQCGAGDLFIRALVADGQDDLESVDHRFHAFDAPGERFRMSLLRMAVDGTDQRDDAVLDRDGDLTGFQGLIRLQRQADALPDLVVAHFRDLCRLLPMRFEHQPRSSRRGSKDGPFVSGSGGTASSGRLLNLTAFVAGDRIAHCIAVGASCGLSNAARARISMRPRSTVPAAPQPRRPGGTSGR